MNTETLDVLYSFAGPLALGGVGNIAYEGLQVLHRKRCLQQVFATHCRDDIAVAKLTQCFRLASALRRVMHVGKAFDFLTARKLTGFDHLHAWSMPALRLVRRARQQGMKIVVEHASTHPMNFYEQVTQERETFGSKECLQRSHFETQLQMIEMADAVVVPSEQVRQTFLDRGFDAAKLHVNPFGVHVDRFSDSHDRGDTFRFLFVGQVSLRKGLQYVLAAFRKLNLTNAELVCVGPVLPDAKAVVAEYSDMKNIIFTGMDQQPWKQYRHAHACVFPSIEEGSALVSYEAQSCALPLIVTPQVGAMMTDEREGLIVPARNIDALAEAMLLLYEDRDMCEAMGAAGRKNMEVFPWSRYSQGVYDCHLSLRSNT